jgi:hypothetical protein
MAVPKKARAPEDTAHGRVKAVEASTTARRSRASGNGGPLDAGPGGASRHRTAAARREPSCARPLIHRRSTCAGFSPAGLRSDGSSARGRCGRCGVVGRSAVSVLTAGSARSAMPVRALALVSWACGIWRGSWSCRGRGRCLRRRGGACGGEYPAGQSSREQQPRSCGQSLAAPGRSGRLVVAHVDLLCCGPAGLAGS